MEEAEVLNNFLVVKKHELLLDMDLIIREKDIHWSQKAKCKWLNEGEWQYEMFS